LTTRNNIRIVPGGSSIREGAHIGENVIMMPPMYINVGAFIDDGSMIDSHALVGTCAQIGKYVHLSAASQIGGVLEPISANPVIIEDNVFIGGNCGIYEGVIVDQNAIIAAGVTITGGTPVFDSINNRFLKKDENNSLHIPEGAVVVPGSRKMKNNENFSIYCPIIIKYRDEKSNRSVILEEALR
ncbi:MAG: 2,3,4,5-tetrahydropyridine-2,6-dicarboxylate N-succinyltransferase, partial [Candidatus Cloacimonetes bacterium]|nr:2,3,4,5-tetrahydropyridine-2,6-dicarboxylate N-succinyltransferase [Candidatus Cloacimonadota bacterium]